jgi:transposase
MTRKSYPTDLTDLYRENIAHLIPPPKTGGRPRTSSNREFLNAIFYHVRAGGSWRCLPRDFTLLESAYAYFRAWQEDGTWQTIHDALRDQCRIRKILVVIFSTSDLTHYIRTFADIQQITSWPWESLLANWEPDADLADTHSSSPITACL